MKGHGKGQKALAAVAPSPPRVKIDFSSVLKEIGKFDPEFCNPTQLTFDKYNTNHMDLLNKIPNNNIYDNLSSLCYDVSTLHKYTSEKILKFKDNGEIELVFYLIIVDVCYKDDITYESDDSYDFPDGTTDETEDSLLYCVQQKLMKIPPRGNYRFIECHGDKCRLDFHSGNVWCASCKGDFDASQLMNYVLSDCVSFSDIKPQSIVFAEIESQKSINWSDRNDLNSVLELVNPVLKNIASMNAAIADLDRLIDETKKTIETTIADETTLNSFIQSEDPKDAPLIDLLKRKFRMIDGAFALDTEANVRLMHLQETKQTHIGNLETYLEKYPKEKYAHLQDLATRKLAEIDDHERRIEIEKQKKQVEQAEAELALKAAQIADQMAQLKMQKKKLYQRK